MAEPPGVELPGGIVARYQGEQALAEPINATMIRLWCEMVEDANPIYHDADFARSRGFKDIVAPPTMLLAWTFEPTWTPGAGRSKEKRGTCPKSPAIRTHACCASRRHITAHSNQARDRNSVTTVTVRPKRQRRNTDEVCS